VDLLLYTDGQPRSGAYAARRQLAPQAINGFGQTRDLDDFLNQPVDAVAGLARPQAFFDMLRARGLQLAQTHALADHDTFEGWVVTATGHPLLCTEKDAAKLWRHQPEAWAVPLQLQVPDDFWQTLDTWLISQGLLAS